MVSKLLFVSAAMALGTLVYGECLLVAHAKDKPPVAYESVLADLTDPNSDQGFNVRGDLFIDGSMAGSFRLSAELVKRGEGQAWSTRSELLMQGGISTEVSQVFSDRMNVIEGSSKAAFGEKKRSISWKTTEKEVVVSGNSDEAGTKTSKAAHSAAFLLSDPIEIAASMILLARLTGHAPRTVGVDYLSSSRGTFARGKLIVGRQATWHESKALLLSAELPMSRSAIAAFDPKTHTLLGVELENPQMGMKLELRPRAEGALDGPSRYYERGDEIQGIVTHEGRPKNGLWWRLRMAKNASKTNRQRLILWLHPSGGSMNTKVEAMAPELAARGFALLVPTAKQWAGWRKSEYDSFVKETLTDVSKIAGVDISKPVLFGYSAGGQAAITLWLEDASRFGGIALNSAYPIDLRLLSKGQVKLKSLPQDDAVRSAPILSICGDQDQYYGTWTQVESVWKKAGVLLELVTVAGRGHEWLMEGKTKIQFIAWLKRLSSKKKEESKTAKTAK